MKSLTSVAYASCSSNREWPGPSKPSWSSYKHNSSFYPGFTGSWPAKTSRSSWSSRYLLTSSFFVLSILLTNLQTLSQSKADSIFLVRGFAIAAPSPQLVDSFITFIQQELGPRNVNTLMRVDFNYQYKSHPELAQENSLSVSDVKKIVSACRQNRVRLIPQVNLLI